MAEGGDGAGGASGSSWGGKLHENEIHPSEVPAILWSSTARCGSEVRSLKQNPVRAAPLPE